MSMLIALGVVEQHTGAQAEHAQEPQPRKTATRLLGAGLRIGSLIFLGVGQADRGGIDQLGTQAVPERSTLLTCRRQRDPQPRQRVQWQSLSSLAVGAVTLVDVALILEGEEGLNLSHDLAAGALGIKHLIEEAKEGAAHAKDTLAAVGSFLGLGQQAGRQQRPDQQFQVAKALLTEVLDPVAQGGQPGTKGGEERSVHDKYIYLSRLDVQLKMISCQKTLPPPTPSSANTNACAPAWPKPVTSARARCSIAPPCGLRAPAISGPARWHEKPSLLQSAQSRTCPCDRPSKIGVPSNKRSTKWKSYRAKSCSKLLLTHTIIN